MVKNLDEQRLLIAEYNAMKEEDRKYVRHQLYTKTGAFGKEWVKTFPKMSELETMFPRRVT